MNDALLVRGFEGFGDLPRDRQRLVQRYGARARCAAPIPPSTSSMTSARTPPPSSEAVDGGNVRMVQRREDLASRSNGPAGPYRR